MSQSSMVGIDTNVLLRVMLADDREQVEAVRRFLFSRSADAPAFISLLVVAEASWVLKKVYRMPNAIVAAAFLQLLASSEFAFEEESFLTSLFRAFPAGKSDIADHIVAFLAKRAGCSVTMTFDRTAAHAVPGMELLA